MRKIAALLATIMVFSTVAMSVAPAQTVQAFSNSVIDYTEYTWYQSSKAGTVMYFSMNPGYENAKTLDVTGWKAAVCPENALNLSSAVAVFDVTKEDLKINDEYQYANINMSVNLTQDIPEGYYCQCFFDAEGNLLGDYHYSQLYINKELVTADACVMNGDGYAYAYVYSESPMINADTYPTLYAVDKQTAVTSYVDYKVTTSDYGDTVHNYKLKILDQSAFTMDSGYYTTLYYKMGTPNVQLSVSGNDAGVANDGGVGLKSSDALGFGYLTVRDMNAYVEAYGLNEEVRSPFDEVVVEEDDDDDDDVPAFTATATVGGQQIDVAVNGLQGSDNAAVQASIDTITILKSQVTLAPSEVIKALNTFAPAMHVSNVLAGGTLDLEIGAGTDISSGAQITFSDENIAAQVKSGDKVVVLHVKHDGSIEYLPAVAGDGTITATFTSLSPVAWFKVETSANSNLVSPKTGVSFWDFLMGLFR